MPTIKETKTGLASFYGAGLEGNKTANGSIFNSDHFVAAHPTYPFGTIVRVTCLDDSSTVHVTITDRGPVKEIQKEGVIIDLSHAAAKHLKMTADGRAKVKVEVLDWGKDETSNR